MNLAQRFGFLLGQVGVMVLARFFFSWVLKYADQKDVTGNVLFVAAAVGTAMLVARFIDGVLDPLMGTYSDRFVAKGRERRKLLIYSFLLAPIGLAITFAPAFGMSEVLRWTLFLVGFFVFFIGYTFYAIPFWSLVEDYGGDDARERSILSNLLGAGLLLAVAIANVAGPQLIGDHETGLGYGKAAIVLAVIGVVLMALPYFSQPKGFKQKTVATHAPGGAKAMFGLLKDRRFLAVLLMFCGSQMALTVISLAAPFVCERLLDGTDKDVSKIMTPFLGTAIPCFVLVPWFARRLGWERAMLVASLVLALVYIGVAFLGSSVIGTPMTTAMVLFGLGGPAVAVLLGLENEAIANCARDAGGSQVSLYFGSFNLGVKGLNGVATFCTGILVTYATNHPDQAVFATRMMGVLAGVMLFIGVGLYFVVRPKPSPAATLAS